MTINRPSEARQMLATVPDALAAAGDSDTAAWFAAGLESWNRGEHKTLCTALGVRADGIPSPATEAAQRRMREALQTAFALAPFDPSQSTTQRLQALGDAITRFESSSWRWSRDRDAPPETFNSRQAGLWLLLKAGARVPRSARQLRRLLIDGVEYD